MCLRGAEGKKKKMMTSNSNVDKAQKANTSIRIFRKFIEQKVLENGEIVYDASKVISPECYDMWMKTRRTLSNSPEKSFQRALSSHVCGVDGRHPFKRKEALIFSIILFTNDA